MARGLRWLFVDMNSYFASCEQHKNPEFKGQAATVAPMLVDTTCTIAASYEAKAFGIKTGAPIWEAKELCPHIRVGEARPKLYVEMHHQILEAIETRIPVEVILSIDEVACRLDRVQSEPDKARSLARDIKKAIHDKVGASLTCSVGIASNQLLAKLASDMQKPDGDITPIARTALLRSTPAVIVQIICLITCRRQWNMEDKASAAAAFLNALKTLPFWLFAGLAVAGVLVLSLPPLGFLPAGVLASFRMQWGAWIWAGTILAATLAVLRAGTDAVIHYRRSHSQQPLLLMPRPAHCWWSVAKQQDDTFVSQIALDIDLSNRTEAAIRLLDIKLIRPWWHGEILTSIITLPDVRNMHSQEHPVPARGTKKASGHILVRGKLGTPGKALIINVLITDQTGARYLLKRIKLRSMTPLVPAAVRRKELLNSIRKKMFTSKPSPLPEGWAHDGTFADVDNILNEERRHYAANGRTRGGLGSLNVTLQSEPNYGVTTSSQVPGLLWDAEHRPAPIDSQNFARLLRLHSGADPDSKRSLEDYLISHLDRRSGFSDVAYFIFLALHRVGRTIDALAAAHTHLAGDRVFGYSNLLGILAALVSREHFDIDPALYDRITELLTNDPEHSFRLIEKMNLARLQHMDARAREG